LRILCVAVVCPAALHCGSSDDGEFSVNVGDSGQGAMGDGSGSQDAGMGLPDSQGGAPDVTTGMMDSTAPPPPPAEGGGGGDDGSTTGTPDSSTPQNDGGVVQSDGGKPPCKRGVAGAVSAGLAPTASAPGVVWYYDWSSGGSSNPIEFVPMIWGANNLGDNIPSGSKFLLGFNEPNFMSQANMTPQEMATDWPQLEAKAQAAGNIPLVSPAVNYCGGCTVPTITDPYGYIQAFLTACTGCEVDYIAVHWYNCDLGSLQTYIEGDGSPPGSGGMPGFVQFGKPIWLTEFSCDGSASVAQQKAYMQAAIPWLEQNPHIYRYSWFSAGPIPNALLINPDGSLTDLGNTYVSLPAACQ
jgi:hypothetical protein